LKLILIKYKFVQCQSIGRIINGYFLTVLHSYCSASRSIYEFRESFSELFNEIFSKRFATRKLNVIKICISSSYSQRRIQDFNLERRREFFINFLTIF